MRTDFVFITAASIALFASACNRPSTATADGEETQLADTESSANQEVLDASDAAEASPFFASGASSSANPMVAGCEAQKQVLATATACGTTYNSQVKLTWSCVGMAGGTSQGEADVATTVTPDACPPTQVSIARQISYDRTRTKGAFSGNLSGTANVNWDVIPGAAAATKEVALSLEHKVTKDGNLIRHQTITGNKIVDFNGNGPGTADDTRVANGSLDVKFLLAGSELNATESNLTFNHSCCYPVAGTISWVKSGNATGQGSITFGPACGQAINADGDSLALPDCSEQQ
ncbi:MAG TPA: hypothetical protein VMV18_15315 [bacterium]|nr:hypothetical protein [bacterium]